MVTRPRRDGHPDAPPIPGRGPSRRATLRLAATAAGAWLAAPLLGGCAGRGATSPLPGSTPPRTILRVQLSYHGASPYGGVIRELVDGYLASHFSNRHRGVAVRTLVPPAAPAASPTAAPETAARIIAPVVAGTGPDILSGTGYDLPAYLGAGLLVPLDGFIHTSGLDLGIFDPGHLVILREVPGGLFGLPAYDGPDVILVNSSLLASAGLSFPSPSWTSAQAVTLWQRLSGQRHGRHQWGMSFNLQEYFLNLFGGQLMDAAGTRCLLDRPLVLEAADWLVPLYQNGVAAVLAGGASANVRSGIAACGMTGGRSLQADLLAMAGMGVEWDFLPMPVFPGGRRSTYNNGDWYGINAQSKHPRALLWELFRFVATDAGLARLLFQTTFVPPNQRPLWETWLATVRAAAPVLRTKRLDYFVQAMEYGFCNRRFRYHPYTCYDILQRWIIRIFLGTVSAATALRRATTEINALQTPG